MRRASLWLALVWLATAHTADAQAPAEFTVLTYNTHALPAWIARDDPERRLPLLLERAGAYDLVLLQEDFAYHERVLEHAPHPLVARGNGPTPGWLGWSGSGLTVLARAPAPRVERAQPYRHCNGWLGAGSDCFGNKGYLMLRLRVAEGVEIDVWNTHLDAGFDDADHEARAIQLDLLGDAIVRESRGRALVVGGDFNTDWSRARDRALLEAFVARIGATIAVSNAHPHWPLRLDYLLVRSGARIALESLKGGVAEEFVDADGSALSDHPALWARLRASSAD